MGKKKPVEELKIQVPLRMTIAEKNLAKKWSKIIMPKRKENVSGFYSFILKELEGGRLVFIKDL